MSNWLARGLISSFSTIFKVFSVLTLLAIFIYLGYFIYQLGKIAGARQAALALRPAYSNYRPARNASPTPTSPPRPQPPSHTGFSGPQLWEAINKSRIEHGVNPLRQLDIFCTIAAIRLNQQLTAGTLDNHAGFEPTLEQVKDSKNYNVAEFLVFTQSTAADAVNLWLNTLGHRSLLTGGEYVYGCAYAQAGFGVAIAGY